ncbi:hypothetical protein BD779DRAFT_1492768 [Infundibulicybe gibba]|nr:hypothetical protein BD779DRAFT_1492768 [Infundibulicybe gibba]
MRRYNRTASFAITLFGAITNFALAIQIIWGILCAYFTAAAAVSSVGFAGLLKNKATMVRFYRDYSIADFSFCGFLAVVGTYSAFRSTAGAGVCEELSRHPEIMRDMLEMGLNIENCERWFGQALFAWIAITVVVMVIRFQRVLLLPRPISQSSQDDPSTILVYAPVPMKSLSPEAAQELSATATEAWVTRSDPEMQRHHRRHRRSSSSSSTKSDSTGQIRLSIQPGEALLPAYEAPVPAAKV